MKGIICLLAIISLGVLCLSAVAPPQAQPTLQFSKTVSSEASVGISNGHNRVASQRVCCECCKYRGQRGWECRVMPLHECTQRGNGWVNHGVVECR